MFKVGILNLQGSFSKHKKILNQLGVKSIYVNKTSHLKDCSGLIIPGGESSTLSTLINKENLYNSLKEFSLKFPIYGTCSGLILMAKNNNDMNVISLDLIDIDVSRNAYGRQIDSFINKIDVKLGKKLISTKAVFIRAPKINKIGKNVKILSFYKNNPIFVQQDHHFASTFHPELTNDKSIHEFFVSKVMEVAVG